MSWLVPPGVNPVWDSVYFWTWMTISFLTLWNFQLLSFQIFSQSLYISLLPFWDPYNANVYAFDNVSVFSFLFILFFFILFHGSDFSHSVLQLTYSFFCLIYCAIDSFKYTPHFIYHILQLCLDVLHIFSLLKISYSFFLCPSILIPSSVIIFMIIVLNTGISTLLSCSVGILFSFLNIFLCNLIFSKFLFVLLCTWKVVSQPWEVALSRGCLMCPSSTLSSHHPNSRHQLVWG